MVAECASQNKSFVKSNPLASKILGLFAGRVSTLTLNAASRCCLSEVFRIKGSYFELFEPFAGLKWCSLIGRGCLGYSKGYELAGFKAEGFRRF